MKNRYQTASNSARFFDADIPVTTIFTHDSMAAFAAGDVVSDPEGIHQTIMELSALPGGITRVLLARL